MELHCSQTLEDTRIACIPFETPMELHCSQTPQILFIVLKWFETPMELHCSQTNGKPILSSSGLRPLWNYTALKQDLGHFSIENSLRPLWNYTALKPQISNSESKSRKQPAIV